MDDTATQTVFRFFTEVGIIHQLGRALIEARLPPDLTATHFGLVGHLSRRPEGETPLQLARAFQLPIGRSGALVQRVTKGSAGERLGIQGGSIPATIQDQEVLLGGDIIIEAGGIRVNRKDFFRRFIDKLENMEPEDEFTVLVLRGGKEKLLKSTYGELRTK